MLGLSFAGLGVLVLSILAFTLLQESLLWLGRVIGALLLFAFCGGVLQTTYIFWSLWLGRFRECERLLDLVELQGDELVLDVGCGRGLILNAAARRLTKGKAIGIDIWSQRDQCSNRPEETLRNARREGVETRVEILDGDARQMPFEDQHFEVVTSSLLLHNLHVPEDRRQVLNEIMRVLKPGGRFAILDFQHVKEYATVLKQRGALDVRIIGPHYLIFPGVWIVVGYKSK